ncbi:hypothetical protein EfmAA242_33770 (plasmid) [Enterococcus faecium]|nr:hypothetical protein EfmAA242_33770 [Enterococcus faecium]
MESFVSLNLTNNTQLKKINNLDILTLRPDHEQLFMSFKKQLKEIQKRYNKVFPNA